MWVTQFAKQQSRSPFDETGLQQMQQQMIIRMHNSFSGFLQQPIELWCTTQIEKLNLLEVIHPPNHPHMKSDKCNCPLLHQHVDLLQSTYFQIPPPPLHFPHRLISNLCKISSDCLPHFPLIFPPKKSTIFCRKPSSLGSGGADRDSSCGLDPPPPE